MAKRKNYDSAVELYNNGLSIQDVGDFFNITRQAMHMILKRRGVVFRNNKKYGEENHFYRGGAIASDRTHNILEQAIKKGIVTKKTSCDKCGSEGVFKDGRNSIQAHHKDYNKPLDVDWVCQKCHHEWHKNNKAIERKEDLLESIEGVINVVSAGFP